MLRRRQIAPSAIEQQPVERVDRLGRLLGAAGDADRHAVAAQPLDRRGQRGGQPLDEDDHRVGAGAGGEPRLALDHGAAGERQRRPQMPRLARFVIGRDQRRQRHFLIPPREAADGKRAERAVAKRFG